MTSVQLDDFVQSFLQTWSSHDIGAIMDLMTDDCEFEPSSRAWGIHYKGAAEVRAAVEHLFKSAPDIQWRPIRYFAAGNQIVIEVLATGTNDKGEPFETPGCDLLTLRAGKISSKRAYRKL
ncbi:MAG: nuclear transport factor 2 family protein [Pseudanabaenales cyanobacterium]|nr:nuclear transport factor 2 family protein [Pseudanabaenales cyanobacterium]